MGVYRHAELCGLDLQNDLTAVCHHRILFQVGRRFVRPETTVVYGYVSCDLLFSISGLHITVTE